MPAPREVAARCVCEFEREFRREFERDFNQSTGDDGLVPSSPHHDQLAITLPALPHQPARAASSLGG